MGLVNRYPNNHIIDSELRSLYSDWLSLKFPYTLHSFLFSFQQLNMGGAITGTPKRVTQVQPMQTSESVDGNDK